MSDAMKRPSILMSMSPEDARKFQESRGCQGIYQYIQGRIDLLAVSIGREVFYPEEANRMFAVKGQIMELTALANLLKTLEERIKTAEQLQKEHDHGRHETGA